MERLVLVGSDHTTNVYNSVMELLERERPDAITLEYDVDSGCLDSVLGMTDEELDILDHMQQLDFRTQTREMGKLSLQLPFDNYDSGSELYAGIVYALRTGTPVFLIDYGPRWELAHELDLTTPEGRAEVLDPTLEPRPPPTYRGPNKETVDEGRYYHVFGMYRSGTLDDAEEFADVPGERKDVSVRNHYMARALERVYERTQASTIVHIGGSGHYEPTVCLPLQDMVCPEDMEIRTLAAGDLVVNEPYAT